MEGLEASVARASQLERTSRIDAEYFQKRFLLSAELIAKWQRKSVQALAHVSDGNHFTISDAFLDKGIPYYRGQDVTNRFFAETASPICITQEAYDRKYMRRSYLQRGDVLLSIVGTIGELSLVASDDPATCSCKLAILRPRKTAPEFLAVFLRSEHGQNQVERLTRGAVQKGLILEDMDQLWVPDVSEGFEKRIAGVVQNARAAQEASASKVNAAEETLLDALGLADWTPPEPLSYAARASDAFAAGRLDARFFAPRIQALLDILGRDGRSLGDLATSRRQKFRPQDCATFNYIEIGDIDGAGAATSTPLSCADAPSRATWHVRPNDIITSTVRPIRRLSAQIAPGQDGYVASSGFVVIDPQQIAPELLLTFLRLPVICELLDLYASASMYPAVTEAHILGLPFPEIDAEVETQVVANIQEAREAKGQAAQLLEAAKRAVEIAIEDGEPAAMFFLGKAEGAD